MNMGKRYKQALTVAGAGLAIALIVGIITKLTGVEPLPGMLPFGLACAAAVVVTLIVWANRSKGEQS